MLLGIATRGPDIGADLYLDGFGGPLSWMRRKAAAAARAKKLRRMLALNPANIALRMQLRAAEKALAAARRGGKKPAKLRARGRGRGPSEPAAPEEEMPDEETEPTEEPEEEAPAEDEGTVDGIANIAGRW